MLFFYIKADTSHTDELKASRRVRSEEEFKKGLKNFGIAKVSKAYQDHDSIKAKCKRKRHMQRYRHGIKDQIFEAAIQASIEFGFKSFSLPILVIGKYAKG